MAELGLYWGGGGGRGGTTFVWGGQERIAVNFFPSHLLRTIKSQSGWPHGVNGGAWPPGSPVVTPLAT